MPLIILFYSYNACIVNQIKYRGAYCCGLIWNSFSLKIWVNSSNFQSFHIYGNWLPQHGVAFLFFKGAVYQESVNTGLDNWNGGIVKWWTGIVQSIICYTYLTCAHTIIRLIVLCAGRWIKLLLVNKVTYCIYQRVLHLQYCLYLYWPQKNFAIISLHMYSGTSKLQTL